jgi:hypothetical protein
MMNQANGFRTFREVVYDMIGRSASNANVYDMIKRVRSFVQQTRQSYRETVPTIISGKFSRHLEDSEWTSMFNSMGKTDLASLLVHGVKMEDVLKMLVDRPARAARIKELEAQLNSLDSLNYARLKAKTKQLATFMVTGKPGTNLLRNAVAVSNLLNENTVGTRKVTDQLVATVDQLASLYALNDQSVGTNTEMAKLFREEQPGLSFAMSYLMGQRVEESRKGELNDIAQLNNYKGYIPSEQQEGVHLVVADDSQFADLALRSYTRVGDYVGSTVDGDRTKRGYYFANVQGKAFFNQGIFQNVRRTMNGVDEGSGFTIGSFGAGRITDRADVAATLRSLGRERGNENLLPVFDAKGKTVAFERSIDPAMKERINGDSNLAKMIGAWRGRQAEEETAHVFNELLAKELAAVYDKDMASKGKSARVEYVDINDPKELARDPVLRDAVGLLTVAARAQLEDAFNSKEFWVRKDMLNDALGYRASTVGDAWTGNSRWSPKTQEEVKKIAIAVFGNKAYQYLVNSEKIIQNYVGDARVMIVVKSMVVPLTNLMANMYQMTARGIPLTSIVRGMPKKLAEVDSYTKTKLEHTRLEAELLAAKGDVIAERKIQAQMTNIEDAHRRLSIWPLIANGEFSAISDAGISRDQILLTEGKLHAFIESKVNRLPKAMQTAGRYALVTKDTALFQGLQLAVEYGDFLAKAILFDDLTIRQKKTQEHALGRVTEEFVNYDRLPGRSRGYLENMGLLWFYNFKIRSAKIALSMIRNNPAHAILAGLTPAPDGVGTPLGDNIFSKGLSGALGGSIGIGMGLRAPTMYPVMQVLF